MKRVQPWMRAVGYIAIGLVVGFFAAKLYLSYQQAKNPTTRGRQQREGQEGLINPLLDCEVVNKLNIQEFKPFEANITHIIDDEVSRKHAKHISVYFRGLNSGRWLGINEDDTYIGASLIKLPVAFTYYKLAENNALSLEQSLINDVDPANVTNQNIVASHTISRGQAYTFKDLLRYMLAYSDNTALTALTQHVPQKEIDDIFSDVGIERKLDASNNVLISPKAYSSFFRILYNATLFSQEHSEEILKTLSESDYRDGIVAGVPKDMTVAHKFGERSETDENLTVTNRELHDCGIIYFPDHPYILCIMTRGDSITELSGVIQRISKSMFDNWSNYWKQNAN